MTFLTYHDFSHEFGPFTIFIFSDRLYVNIHESNRSLIYHGGEYDVNHQCGDCEKNRGSQSCPYIDAAYDLFNFTYADSQNDDDRTPEAKEFLRMWE